MFVLPLCSVLSFLSDLIQFLVSSSDCASRNGAAAQYRVSVPCHHFRETYIYVVQNWVCVGVPPFVFRFEVGLSKFMNTNIQREEGAFSVDRTHTLYM